MEGRIRTLVVTLFVLGTVTYIPIDLLNHNGGSTTELQDSKFINSVNVNDSLEWDLTAGNWYSIQTNCQTCTSSLFFNDVMIQSDELNYSGQVSEDGKIKLIIENPQSESFESSFLMNVSDNHLNTRPGPQTDFSLSSVFQCPEENHCIDKDSPVLASKLFRKSQCSVN